ncbi:HAMP domain-containing sensor histidine kinase [Alteromonas sp. C1M14]|uniref:sensor histidine kinase n=1 Tax=Alteromonas sp. C1M14 TaxID=2841567 RepID=UPI001C08F5FB|nr:HAMP domain-containing sensor histidine kinase [Alteromonas sp. C1M14]MBU2978165.1 HAMP domain-containing histidine kinase [Alteromonas sp. C1M14]
MVRAFSLSLRRYVIAALFVVGTSMTVGFSLLAMNNFFEGMDGMMRGTMLHTAEDVAVKAGNPVNILTFTIVGDWNDFPDEVTRHFDPNQLQPFKLEKYIERDFIFLRPKRAVFVLSIVDRDTNERKYIAQVFSRTKRAGDSRYMMSHEGWSLLIGLGVLVTFSLLLLVLMRSVSRPVERLRQWAKTLDENTLSKPTPNFKYQELNELAEIVHASLQDVRKTLTREREFVSHASHELRTPIAVIRSSVELLHKFQEKGPGMGGNAIRRIEHASHTMTNLTETLLWLGRNDTDNLISKTIQPGALLTELVDELGYLLTGKQVTINIDTDNTEISLPATATRIVLGNLIRNAFQHTQQGSVQIIQSGTEIRIINDDELGDDDTPTDNEHSGYGLGLQLVHRITKKLGWGYQQAFTATGCQVKIVLQASE